MIFNMGGPIKSKAPPTFSYTGVYKFVDEGNDNWHIEFLTSGRLTFNKINSASEVDMFLVAGGKPGQAGRKRTNADPGQGGNGGNGGECKTERDIHLKSGSTYQVIIGISGQDTSIAISNKTYLARSGYGAPGGAGGSHHSGNNGSNGSLAFGDYGSTLYGPGGGGGSTDQGSSAGRGGKDGGGNGGRPHSSNYSGTAGKANTGAGGGGGGADWYQVSKPNAPGGPGGSGIFMLRNHRK